MVFSSAPINIVSSEVRHFNKSILGRGWMIATQLLKKKIKTHSNFLLPIFLQPDLRLIQIFLILLQYPVMGIPCRDRALILKFKCAHISNAGDLKNSRKYGLSCRQALFTA